MTMGQSISAFGLLSPKRVCKFVCVGALAVVAVVAQSGRAIGNYPTTFHVQGTVRKGNSGIAGVDVKFEGKVASKTVSSNHSGFYRAELPVGFYTMLAALPGTDQNYRRRFLVSSRRMVVLDVAFFDDPDCDPVFPRIVQADGTPISPEPTQDDYQDICGGTDFASVPSGDGEPFELLIHYSNRRRTDVENTYTSYGGQNPVFVAYNLFSLSADKVIYNATNRTINASGDVVTRDLSGKPKHFNSAIFKIENGEVSALER